MNPRAEPETSQTLDRGLRVMEELAEASGGLTVAELALRIDAPRAAVYRFVATLEAHGYVRRGSDGRVRLGFGVLHLARRVQPILRSAAVPVLRRLAEDLGATAHLTVAEGTEGLAVAVVEPSWTDFHVAYRVGSRHLLTQGAAGKAILLGRAGAHDPGYAASESDLQPGAHGLAAPIRDVAGLEASIGIVAFTPFDVADVVSRVIRAAAEISVALR